MSDLEPRAANLLKLLVERYIKDGQPVASRQLSKAVGNALSPATIRNVMADLDELGFVCSPHTSAGRVPTSRGYRFFVDSLLEPERVPARTQQRMAREILSDQGSGEAMLQAASSVLSSLTTMAGVVTVPRRNRAVLRRIEFLPLSGQRVLAILVVNGFEVQNRVLATERSFEAAELEQFANVINAHYAGQDLVTLRQALQRDLGNTKQQVDRTLTDALQLLNSASPASRDDGDMLVAGGANLFRFHDPTQIERLRDLFDALDRKRDLLAVFDQCLKGRGVQLFIGEESGYEVLDGCTVVTAPYTVEGQHAGVLGVIGPTRMAYSRIIPLVSDTARILSKGLKAS